MSIDEIPIFSLPLPFPFFVNTPISSDFAEVGRDALVLHGYAAFPVAQLKTSKMRSIEKRRAPLRPITLPPMPILLLIMPRQLWPE
jgi:hypothetical protein